MDLTLGLDDQLVARAREIARQRGTSLNALLREYLELLVNQRSGEELGRDFEELWAEADRTLGGSNRTYKFNREELYDERLDRYRGSRD